MHMVWRKSIKIPGSKAKAQHNFFCAESRRIHLNDVEVVEVNKQTDVEDVHEWNIYKEGGLFASMASEEKLSWGLFALICKDFILPNV